MEDIRDLNKKKINLSEIEVFYKIEEYKCLCDIVYKLISEGILIPIKKNETNGKEPALPLAYWLKLVEEDNSFYIDEIKYKLSTKLDTSYYLKYISKYKEDREYVLRLSNFLSQSENKLKNMISLNERSFEIWGREKFLRSEGGKRIIKNLGLRRDVLNFYPTTEPLAYYSHSKKIPQNILIVENKDTFYSMRKHLLEDNKKILGIEISTLIYGSGKNIIRTLEDLEICAEPYVSDKNNTILYFGDLDYEGIIIYESMKRIFQNKYAIKPFVEGYIAMLEKYENMRFPLPKTKEGQNRNISDSFLGEFSHKCRDKFKEILSADEYIPQEILNIGDF